MKNGLIGNLWYKDDWRTVGPGGGGSMFFPAISPFSPEHIINFCDMTGCYMTRDATNWTPFSLKSKGNCAAFDPNRPEVVYIGSSGLYKSENGGRHWRVVYPQDIIGDEYLHDEAGHRFKTRCDWPGGAVDAVALKKDSPDMLAFGLARTDDVNGINTWVYFSTDGGASFRRTNQPIAGSRFRKLYFDPNSPPQSPRIFVFTDAGLYILETGDMTLLYCPLPADNVWAADIGIDKRTGKAVLYFLSIHHRADGAWLDKKLWRSTDGGANFVQLDYGHPSRRGGQQDGNQLTCCENDAAILYMVINCDDEQYTVIRNNMGIKKSVDYGDTWEWVLEMNPTLPDTLEQGWLEESYGHQYGGAPISIAVSPNNPDILMYTNQGAAARSTDGGQTWQCVYTIKTKDGAWIGRGLEVTTCYGVHFDPHDSKNMMISYTDIGLFRSNDNGESWLHSITGIPYHWCNTCYWVAYDPDIPGKVWGAWGVPHDLPRQKLFNNNKFETARGMRAGGVALSTDGGTNWRKANNGMDEMAVCTHILLDPNSPVDNRRLYAASTGFGVYLSDDGGKSWRLSNKGLGDNLYAWKLYFGNDGEIYLINIRGQRDGKWVPGELYVSYDRAENWQPVPLPGKVSAPNDLSIVKDKLYLACWPSYHDPDAFAGATENGGVYVLEDRGQNWRRLPLPPGIEYTYGVTADEDKIFVVDFQRNCHRSDDGGETWYRLSGYNFKWGHKAFPDVNNPDFIYITTFGGSVWYGPARGNNGGDDIET